METDVLLASSDWVVAGGLFLILIGFSFLILEFFLPSFGLFGFAGISAILIGVIQLHQAGYVEEMPVSIEFLIALIVLGFSLSVAGGIYTWKLYKKKMTTGIEAMLGQTARVLEWKGTKGRVHILGEDWQAYSDKELKLQKEDNVLVSKINGLKIKIITND